MGFAGARGFGGGVDVGRAAETAVDGADDALATGAAADAAGVTVAVGGASADGAGTTADAVAVAAAGAWAGAA